MKKKSNNLKSLISLSAITVFACFSSEMVYGADNIKSINLESPFLTTRSQHEEHIGKILTQASFDQSLPHLSEVRINVRITPGTPPSDEKEYGKAFATVMETLYPPAKSDFVEAQGQVNLLSLLSQLMGGPTTASAQTPTISSQDQAILSSLLSNLSLGQDSSNSRSSAILEEVKTEEKEGVSDVPHLLPLLSISWTAHFTNDSNAAQIMKMFRNYPARALSLTGPFETFDCGLMHGGRTDPRTLSLKYIEKLTLIGKRNAGFDFERYPHLFCAPELKEIAIGVQNRDGVTQAHIVEKGLYLFINNINKERFPKLETVTLFNIPNITGEKLNFSLLAPISKLHIDGCSSVNLPKLLANFAQFKSPVEELTLTNFSLNDFNFDGVSPDVWRSVFQLNPQLKVRTDAKEINAVIEQYESVLK